ncbi:MAG: multicopper oxidase family protein [Longimicrobiales bacterium]
MPCDAAARAPAAPDADLYCIDLIPAPEFRPASGRAELMPAATPFGVAVDSEGHHLYDLAVHVAGLPTPETVGAASYVAWATTPTLAPVARLGIVGDDRTAHGRIAFDEFIVLVTAEPDTSVIDRWHGEVVLRGQSASMRLLPHEGEPLWYLGASAGAGERHDHAPVPALAPAWVLPPMHPHVPMPPGMHGLRPDVAPFMPAPAPSADIPVARPRERVTLGDGATLDLVAGPVRRRIGGRTFTMYGFNGQYPGPLVEVPEDATITVNFTNRTSLPTTVHWHGVRLDNRFDGVPHLTQPPVPPGGSFRYRVHFPDAGLYWYHPHHREDVLQDLGLYGNLQVRSPEPDYYGPAHSEAVLMLDDLLIGDHGPVPYGRDAATHALMGRFGNVFLVNGEPGWRRDVKKGEVVRFFLTNVASTRTFNVSFGGTRVKLVAGDLGRFEREAWVESVVLAPAERYIVDVRFEQPGDVAIVNRVRALDHLYGSFFTETDTLGVVHVSAEAAVPDLSAAFERLRANPELSAEIERYVARVPDTPDHALVLTMRVDSLPFPIEPFMRLDSAYFNPVEWSGTMPMMNWVATGNDLEWILREPSTGRENEEIDWQFSVGDVARIRLTNDRNAFHAMQHPIHIHGQRFLVLSRNGVPNENLVWKDTILLPVGTTADILLELSNPGDWMLHCHIAEHLEAGMKMVLRVR